MSQPLILIQARLGSHRLPGKIHQLIGHKRMLDHVTDRARQTGLKWMLCMPQDYPGVAEDDVLGRFHAALESIDPEGDHYDPIIRLTADTPLLESQLVHTVLHAYRERDVDWAGTGPEWDGLDVEVISRASLARAHHRAWDPYEREHVTLWLKRYGRCHEIPAPERPLRFSVDDQAGLDFVRAVYRACDLCAGGTPRHTNTRSDIGGADRHIVWDLHDLGMGGLAECQAYDLLKIRMGGPVYVSA